MRYKLKQRGMVLIPIPFSDLKSKKRRPVFFAIGAHPRGDTWSAYAKIFCSVLSLHSFIASKSIFEI